MIIHNEKDIFSFLSFFRVAMEMLKLLKVNFCVGISRICDGNYSIAFQFLDVILIAYMDLS